MKAPPAPGQVTKVTALSDQLLLELIDDMGEAALSQQWRPFLKRLEGVFNVAQAGIALLKLKDDSPELVEFQQLDTSNLSRADIQQFWNHWFMHDRISLPMLERAMQHAGTPQVQWGAEHLDLPTLQRSAYYHEYGRYHGIYHQMNLLGVDPTRTRIHSLVLSRGQRQPAFSDTEARFLGCLSSCLKRAQVIQERLGQANRLIGNQELFRHLPFPLLLLDHQNTVLELNQAAEGWLAAHLAQVTLRQGHLTFRAQVNARELDTVLNPSGSWGWAGPAAQVRLSPPLQGTRLTAAPLHMVQATWFCQIQATLLLHIDPGPPQPIQPWHAPFQLTPREVQVAELCAQGLSTPQIAERLSLGTGTVRHHLKQIYAKTGVHRQSALARLVEHP